MNTRRDSAQLTVRTIRLMAVFRYIIILLGISFLLIRLFRSPDTINRITVLGPYIIFIVGAILNTIYLSLLLTKGIKGHLHSLVILQITVDAFLISGLVFFTGGLFSAITSFYFAVILTASITLSRKESIFFASLCIILFSIIHIMYAVKFHQSLWEASWLYQEWRGNLGEIISRLLFHAAGFYTVAILSGTLNNLLRSVRILNEEILENINEGILVIDAGGQITFHNQTFLDLLNLNVDQLPGNMLEESPFDSVTTDRIRAILDGDLSQSGEIEFPSTNKDTPVSIIIKATRLVDRNDQMKGTILLFEDVSASKQIEKAKQRIDRYRSIVEMSAGIAHEIRNPLASIRGCAEELAADTEFSGTNQRMFTIIKEESDRLTNIITDFFNYMKESPPQRVPTVLSSVINESIELAGRSPVFNNININNNVPQDMTIMLDRDQWKQVFLNLFLNAAEAMTEEISIKARQVEPEGVAFARKFVSAEEIEGGIEITVSDTGQGIPSENVSDIFIPFYTTKDQGVGVGLSVVNRIVRSHGGIIEVSSSGTRGTSFIITLAVYKERPL